MGRLAGFTVKYLAVELLPLLLQFRLLFLLQCIGY